MKVQKKEKQAYHSEAKDSEDLSSTIHFRACSDEELKSYILLRKGMDNSKTELLFSNKTKNMLDTLFKP